MIIRKKGAMELSVSTIVIIVIAMSMLILGLVLVRTIFTESIYNVKILNDKVRGQIQKLFAEEGKSVVYLAEGKADIRQGDDMGIAFAFRNTEKGTTSSAKFEYIIKAASLGSDCQGLTQTQAENWIKSRQTGSANLPPGETAYFIVRFEIPDNAPLCIVPFDIEIRTSEDGLVYATDFFDVIVK